MLSAADVADIRAAGVEQLDLGSVDVEAERRETRARRRRAPAATRHSRGRSRRSARRGRGTARPAPRRRPALHATGAWQYREATGWYRSSAQSHAAACARCRSRDGAAPVLGQRCSVLARMGLAPPPSPYRGIGDESVDRRSHNRAGSARSSPAAACARGARARPDRPCCPPIWRSPKKYEIGTPRISAICRQPRGADPVGAAFVFLHLLKRQAERIGERLLVHAEQQAAHADASADMNVDGIGNAGAAPVFFRLGPVYFRFAKVLGFAQHAFPLRFP